MGTRLPLVGAGDVRYARTIRELNRDAIAAVAFEAEFWSEAKSWGLGDELVALPLG